VVVLAQRQRFRDLRLYYRSLGFIFLHRMDSSACVLGLFPVPVSRGRVSKQDTNGSKTAVMDVSLGSSTVQLHDSLGSRHACSCSEAGFSSQNGYST
jgi:hypothetical protein